MRVFGIVAEYNPFHNGHAFALEWARKQGATHIVACMSGNFVQRGDAAVFDKFTRTKAALCGGADLIVELPTRFAVSTAQHFCGGAVEILSKLNVIDSLFFGSESGDIEQISSAAKALILPQTDALIKQKLQSGCTYAAAREKAVEQLFGQKTAEVLKTPNDILGVEYINAIIRQNSKIIPMCLKRQSVGHNSLDVSKNFASASKLREMLFCDESIANFVPQSAYELYQCAIKNGNAPNSIFCEQKAVLSRLRIFSAEDFAKIPDISNEGLHNRLFGAVQSATTIDEVISLAKTKRYTASRLQRLLLLAALNINKLQPPQYIRVLGFNERGQELLCEIKKRSSLPIVTSYADAKKILPLAKTEFEQEAKYTDFYTLLMQKPLPCGSEQTQAIVKI